MKIPAGQLNRRVVIQNPTNTKNGMGETVQTWGTLATRWAKIREEAAPEAVDRGKPTAFRKITVELRWVDGLTSRCRLTYKGRTFNITSIADSEENEKGHVLTCIEVAA